MESTPHFPDAGALTMQSCLLSKSCFLICKTEKRGIMPHILVLRIKLAQCLICSERSANAHCFSRYILVRSMYVMSQWEMRPRWHHEDKVQIYLFEFLG